MGIPDWRTSKAGARVKVALWLSAEVGEGGAFTKAQLREAFPGVEQIDRRMRDLRSHGWVIATYSEDRSLSGDQLRLVKAGAPVWERGYRSRSGGTRITDKERRLVLAADNYACVYCGVGAGEPYPDDPIVTAKLTAAQVSPPDGGKPQLLTICKRCQGPGRDDPTTASVLTLADDLDTDQLRRLRSWAKAGTRRATPEERVWGDYRRLPYASRQSVLEHLDVLSVGPSEAAPDVSAPANPTASSTSQVPTGPAAQIVEVPERAVPFTAWTPVTLVHPFDASEDQINRGLLQIVDGEGPIRVERAYRLYMRSAGGRAVAGTRELLRTSVTRLEQAGKIAYAWDRPRAIEDRTIFLAGHAEVVVRTCGERRFAEIPPTEIAEVFSWLGDLRQSSEMLRQVLAVFGGDKLTRIAIAHLKAGHRLYRSRTRE